MIGITVNLSQYHLSKKAKKFPRSVSIGLLKGGFHLERIAKHKSPVVTGRYRASWKAGKVGVIRDKIEIGPHVKYARPVEKRHGVAKETADEEKNTVIKIVQSEIRKVLE